MLRSSEVEAGELSAESVQVVRELHLVEIRFLNFRKEVTFRSKQRQER